eukprot:364607-Chlamydomonas_euryale.AAC.1
MRRRTDKDGRGWWPSLVRLSLRRGGGRPQRIGKVKGRVACTGSVVVEAAAGGQGMRNGLGRGRQSRLLRRGRRGADDDCDMAAPGALHTCGGPE